MAAGKGCCRRGLNSLYKATRPSLIPTLTPGEPAWMPPGCWHQILTQQLLSKAKAGLCNIVERHPDLQHSKCGRVPLHLPACPLDNHPCQLSMSVIACANAPWLPSHCHFTATGCPAPPPCLTSPGCLPCLARLTGDCELHHPHLRRRGVVRPRWPRPLHPLLHL